MAGAVFIMLWLAMLIAAATKLASTTTEHIRSDQ
jgi:hypothetical protein